MLIFGEVGLSGEVRGVSPGGPACVGGDQDGLYKLSAPEIKSGEVEG